MFNKKDRTADLAQQREEMHRRDEVRAREDMRAREELREREDIRDRHDMRGREETLGREDVRDPENLRARDDIRVRPDDRIQARERAVMADAPAVERAPIHADAAPTPIRNTLHDAASSAHPTVHEGPAALFPADQASVFHNQWTDIQAGFVDEPRAAVERADSLVGDVMRKLAEGFAAERAALERHWDRGADVTTEDLRLTLQKYRSFFDRLLKV